MTPTPKPIGVVAVALYFAAVVLANWATAHWMPWHVWGLITTAGTWFIGATFVLRDVVQINYGRRIAYAVVAAALVVNFAMSRYVGDLEWITAGSACAFAVSETFDTEAFTRWRGSIGKRVLASGVASSIVDSLIFAVVALSPLTTGFVAWGDLWRVVVAQVLVKTAVCGIGAALTQRAYPAPVVA